ncbi:hypothetical protein K505DRAFT_297698 [Melanomma pulvis-pyrius CBS 109.77]|uniref:Uncharacterized protein n=1 Tax=Melanomma pulvis-pyrius CBS 109.77 TaxID=1314802 RepID=A0A6A6XPD5_9PLEO|nr:hypothetical protein K505DRAFT_297698 [Melanomma pulvis-pyrius CBS 109.77]
MFSTTSRTTILTALLTLTSAAPSSLSPRQGGAFYAVGELYSSGGCTNLIFGDPIFTANSCVLLDRSGSVPDIVSYKLTSASAGCTVKLYTSTTCEGTAFSATVGACVQAGSPFQSANVTCV